MFFNCLSFVINPVAIVLSCVNFLAALKPNAEEEEEQPILGLGKKQTRGSESFGNFGW